MISSAAKEKSVSYTSTEAHPGTPRMARHEMPAMKLADAVKFQNLRREALKEKDLELADICDETTPMKCTKVKAAHTKDGDATLKENRLVRKLIEDIASKDIDKISKEGLLLKMGELDRAYSAQIRELARIRDGIDYWIGTQLDNLALQNQGSAAQQGMAEVMKSMPHAMKQEPTKWRDVTFQVWAPKLEDFADKTRDVLSHFIRKDDRLRGIAERLNPSGDDLLDRSFLDQINEGTEPEHIDVLSMQEEATEYLKKAAEKVMREPDSEEAKAELASESEYFKNVADTDIIRENLRGFVKRDGTPASNLNNDLHAAEVYRKLSNLIEAEEFIEDLIILKESLEP
jgi:hypothetical protein